MCGRQSADGGLATDWSTLSEKSEQRRIRLASRVNQKKGAEIDPIPAPQFMPEF